MYPKQECQQEKEPKTEACGRGRQQEQDSKPGREQLELDMGILKAPALRDLL